MASSWRLTLASVAKSAMQLLPWAVVAGPRVGAETVHGMPWYRTPGRRDYCDPAGVTTDCRAKKAHGPRKIA